MKKHYGLTLLELLVTISVLIIIITIGSPAITAAQKSLQLKGAVETSYFALQQARLTAIATSKDITVSFAGGNNWCAALSDTGDCDCKEIKNCTVNGIEHRIDSADYHLVDIQNIKFGKDNLAVFDGIRGLAFGHAGSVTFSDGQEQLKLVLSNMGRIRICALNTSLAGYEKC